MNILGIGIVIGVYFAIIALIAIWVEHNEKVKNKLINNGFVYALTVVVYCTAWTYFGSIGRAATTGIGYLGVYLGPTLFAPLWFFVLKKMLQISKQNRITSIADFIVARYARSTVIGIVVSVFCLLVVIPYISIQIKAIEFSIGYLLQPFPGNSTLNIPFYKDPTLIVLTFITLLSLYLGTKRLDPNEQHPGLVTTIALESIIKLIAFLIGAFAILYFVFDGIQDIFVQAKREFDISKLVWVNQENIDYETWIWIIILSGIAFLLLPRQFHMFVVENNDPDHIQEASWVAPLYLFTISLLVIPIAFAGKILLGDLVEADTYLLTIPLSAGYNGVAWIVFIGCLATVSGMLIVSLVSLSIIISNNVFLPLLLRIEYQFKYFRQDLNTRLLQLRRLMIFVIVLLSYTFYNYFTVNYPLVSVGLISFAGIAQLAPAVFLGMYWKESNIKGALTGLVLGILVWAFTLPFANLSELGIIPNNIIKQGLFGMSFLKPTSLLGIEGMSPIAHGAFWSLGINLFTHVIVSLFTTKSDLEISQTDKFVNPDKYSNVMGSPGIERSAKMKEFLMVIKSILGNDRLNEILNKFKEIKGIKKLPSIADSEFINYMEPYISGSFGASTAKIVLNYIVHNEPVDREKLIKLVDQTYQISEYSKSLESQSKELSRQSQELQIANKKLEELDDLKNEFISNVTHELRTPLTSIRSLSNTMLNYELTKEEKEKLLKIISSESDRIAKLVNKVLDLRKIEVRPEVDYSDFSLDELIQEVVDGYQDMAGSRKIKYHRTAISIVSDKQIIKQVLLNLFANAIKFTNSTNGSIQITTETNRNELTIKVIDNGIGIKKEDLKNIFDRFYQGDKDQEFKQKGSGLGLSICKAYIELLEGKISVESTIGKGATFEIKLYDVISN